MRTVTLRNRWVRAAVGAVGTAAALFAGGAVTGVQWIVTPRSAFVVMPPIRLTDQPAWQAEWSTDGEYLLVATGNPTRAASEGEMAQLGLQPAGGSNASLLLWDRTTREVRKVWQSNDPTLVPLNVLWLHGSDTALVVMAYRSAGAGVSPDRFGLMWYAAKANQYRWVPGMERLYYPPAVEPSPLTPIAVVAFPDEPPQQGSEPTLGSYWTMAANGQVLRRRHGNIESAQYISWNADGTDWYVRSKQRGVVLAMADDGVLSTAKAKLYQQPAPVTGELWLHSKTLVATQRKVKQSFNNLWLSSPAETFHPDALVSPAARDALLSPTQDALYYVEAGEAKVRLLAKLSDEQKRALFEMAKRAAIGNAKQCALGLIMYSNDCDDLLPPGGQFDDVSPYIKNDATMADFVYAPPPQLNLTQLQSPATTAIGYINGPGGQAVAYADGHVAWIPSP